MVKKTNCLLCQNLEASEAALRRLWRLAKFLQSSKFYLTFAFTFETGVALILRYLLTDLLLIQTKLALIKYLIEKYGSCDAFFNR